MGSSIIQLIHGAFNTPGPVIAGFLMMKFGLELSMRIIYFIVTTLFLIAALWRLRLKETIANAEPMRFRYFIEAYPKAFKESVNVWKKVPRTAFWIFTIETLLMFGVSLTNVINAVYARDVLGVAENQWWLVYIPLLLTMIIASLPIGKIVDKFGRKIPLIAGLTIFGTATLIFMWGNLPMLMLSMALFAIGQLLTMSSAMALSTDLVTPENRGKVVGFRNFVSYILSGLGMLLGNYLYVSFIPQLPFYTALALIFPALLIAVFLVQESKK